MFIQTLHDNPFYFFTVVITVIVSITIHELSHGLVAIWHGDNTPEETGHMTFNPFVHMGGMSIILLLVAGIAWGAMPVDRSRLRGRHAGALVALAGPVANVLMALLALITVGLWQRFGPDTNDLSQPFQNLQNMLGIFGVINIELAILNMIPIPPLDGSKVLADFSPGYVQLMRSLNAGGMTMILMIGVFYMSGDLLPKTAGRIALALLQVVRGF
jgi:Zn-dependent protease